MDDRTFGRLDAVEIKVTVPAARAFRARTALGLRDDRGERRRLYFCEDPGFGDRFRNAEVGHLQPAIRREQDVLRLYITV